MRVRATAAAVALSALVPALAACGSTPAAAPSVAASPSVTASSPSAAGSTSPTAAGLNNMVVLAKQIANTADVASAKKQAGGLEGLWHPIEDGVKANDKATYTAIEDAMEALGTGVQSKTSKAAADLAAAVNAYVAKYPS